jgi:hypothetical protein
MADPWERLPNETQKAYHAFSWYRDMGPGRTVARVRAEMQALKKAAPSDGGQAVEKPDYRNHRGVLEKWCCRHKWVERATAFDAETERQRAAAQIAAAAKEAEEDEHRRRQALRNHSALAQQGQIKVMEALQSLGPKDLDPADMLAFMRVCIALDRQALGLDALTPPDAKKGGDKPLSTPDGELRTISEKTPTRQLLDALLGRVRGRPAPPPQQVSDGNGDDAAGRVRTLAGPHDAGGDRGTARQTAG